MANSGSGCYAAFSTIDEISKVLYYNRHVNIEEEKTTIYYIQENGEIKNINQHVIPMGTISFDAGTNQKAVNINYTKATCGIWKGFDIKYIPTKIYYYEGTDPEKHYVTPNTTNHTIIAERTAKPRTYVVEYERGKTQALIKLVLDTQEHTEGSQFCIPYTAKTIDYDQAGYTDGIKTIDVKQSEFKEYELLERFTLNGSEYTLINSYLKYPSHADDCEWHEPSTTTVRRPEGIVDTMYIIAEYKTNVINVTIHYMEDTDVHDINSANCVPYTNTAKKIKEDKTITVAANSTVTVELDSKISNTLGTTDYTLINSYLNIDNVKSAHTGASATKSFKVGTSDVHVVAEYKKNEIKDDTEITSTELRLQRLDPLASAQIMSDNRNNSKPKSETESSQVYDVRLTNGNYMGIPTHKTQYAQVLTASRNLIDMKYVRVQGNAKFDVTITKTYPYIWWDACYVVTGCNNSGGISASSPSSGGNISNGSSDTRWRHDEINAAYGSCPSNCPHVRNCPPHTTVYCGSIGGYYNGTVNSTTGIANNVYTSDSREYCTKNNSADCGLYTHTHNYNWGSSCRPLACGIRPHTHSSRCYDEYLSCSSTEEGHKHSSGCYTEYLSCTREEHTHDGDCYPFVCTKYEHVHNNISSSNVITAREGSTGSYHNCYKFDTCYGHSTKYCTQRTFYCSSSCPGHSRQYLGKREYQCEISGCIHTNQYTVDRTYRYERKFVYYYIKEYTAYKLDNSNIYNATLTEQGSVNVKNVDYTLGNRMYVPKDPMYSSGWLLNLTNPDNGAITHVCNYHIKAPLKTQTEVHKFTALNETKYQNRTTLVNGSIYPISNYTNWNSQYAAMQAAKEQASKDLLVSAGTLADTRDTRQDKTYRNEQNDIWMIGENRTVLRVRNDYLWHDGYIMEMYGRISNSQRYVFSNSDGISDSTLNAVLPNNGYYATNRTDVEARATSPEETTGTYIKNEIRDENGYQLIRYGSRDTTYYNITSAASPGRTSPGLGWGEGSNGILLYRKNVLIPRTIPNNIYNSQMDMTYVKCQLANIPNIRPLVPDNTSATQTIFATSNNVNSVVVHAPVYVAADIVQEAEGTQTINPIGTSSELELDKEYTVQASFKGTHRSAKGYANGGKGYEEWIANANGQRMLQISFPFDVYINNGAGYVFLEKGQWQNFATGASRINFKIPVWIAEKEYTYSTKAPDDPAQAINILNNTIVVRVIAENDPDMFGGATTIGRHTSNYNHTGNQNVLYTAESYDYRAYDSINVNVVGKVYNFKVEYTDDDAFTKTMLNFNGLYASELPFGQEGDNPGRPSYQYALRLGYKIKYTVRTKGTKSEEIKIVPSVYYVKKDGTGFRKVNVFYEVSGNKYEQLTEKATFALDTTITKAGELPYVPTNVIEKTFEIIAQIYRDSFGEDEAENKPDEIEKLAAGGDLMATIKSEFNFNKLRKIGTVGKMLLNEYVRLRLDLSEEYEAEQIYGPRTDTQIRNDAGIANNFTKSISQWYGEFRLPSTTVVTEDGKPLYNTSTNAMQNIKTDGYLIVFFNIETLDGDEKPYLSYQLPKPANNTQWGKEGYKSTGGNYKIKLPNGKTVTYTAPDSTQCAPVVIYEALINKDGNVIGPN